MNRLELVLRRSTDGFWNWVLFDNWRCVGSEWGRHRRAGDARDAGRRHAASHVAGYPVPRVLTETHDGRHAWCLIRDGEPVEHSDFLFRSHADAKRGAAVHARRRFVLCQLPATTEALALN